MVQYSSATNLWPKKRPELTTRQREILEDWYLFWLPKLSSQYKSVVRFNHEYAARLAAPGTRTLEIGAGDGEHLRYEDLNGQDYYAVEMRPELAQQLEKRFPSVHTVVRDCEKSLEVPEASFDRVIAIHILEHLANLPAALDEVGRVLKPNGVFVVVIPCEGGLGYEIGRQFSSKRMFEKRYDVSYEWMIRYEHINKAKEVVEELERRFEVKDKTFYPLRIPSIHMNLLLGLTLVPRK
jgi:SAM-dependent methyltransferase